MALLLMMRVLVVTAQTLPTEKIFFASDKMSYTSLDTVRVSGHLLRDDDGKSTVPYSRYVYLELLGDRDSIFCREKVAVDQQGNFSTTLLFDPLAPQGIYYLRAFSKMMCNFPDATIPTFPVELRGAHPTSVGEDRLQCHVFPEGGKLLDGVIQNVGFCLTDRKGLPLQAEASLMDEKGDTVNTARTTPSGWQVFVMQPQKGKSYRIRVVVGGKESFFSLPAVEKEGDVVLAKISDTRLSYTICSSTLSHRKLYAYHAASGLMLLPSVKNGALDLTGMPEGVVSLLLTDENNKVLSECHNWYGSRPKENPVLPVSLKAGQDLRLPPSTAQDATFVRFLPLSEVETSPTRHFIPVAETDIHFGSDLISDRPFPVRYPLETAREKRTDITAWLCSARFKRLDIVRVLKDGFQMKYQPEISQVIRGQVMGGGSKWKLKNGSVVLYQRSNSATFTGSTDAEGRFAIPVADFSPKEEFFVQAYDSKGKTDFYNYTFVDDTIPALKNWNHIERLESTSSDVVVTGSMRQGPLHELQLLPEITVKAKVKAMKKDQTKEFYGTHYISEEKMSERHFSSFARLVDEFFSYMRLSINPASRDQGASAKLLPRRASTLPRNVSPDKDPEGAEIRIYVDGNLISCADAIYLNMDDIATAEYLKPSEALALHQGCINGALELKTKSFREHVVKSKGVLFFPPFGIANYRTPYAVSPVVAPRVPGQYIMLIDRCTPKDIQSSGYQVVVH